MLPKQYAWLEKEPGPRILREAIKLHGVMEAKGSRDNPEILRWAKAIGWGHIYKHDETAWCGLFIAYCAAESGWDFSPRGNPLWARNWLAWGTPVPFGEEMLGDVLIKARGDAGHVGVYVGEDRSHFHIIGGNQGDVVSFKRIPKIRTGKDAFLGARRCPWRVSQPANVRKIWLKPSGTAGGSEA